MSEPALESVEPLFDKSDRSPPASELPEPPRVRRRLSLGSLLLVALLSLALAYLLLPEARFALSGAKPIELGDLTSTDLTNADLSSQHSAWIEGEGLLDSRAVAFRRRGKKGSFRLAQLKNRPDLWVLLHAPEKVTEESYFPPRQFTGRLLSLSDTGLKEAPLLALVKAEARTRRTEANFLLLEGDSPRSERDSLVAAILFGLLGLSCLTFAARLLSRVN